METRSESLAVPVLSLLYLQHDGFERLAAQLESLIETGLRGLETKPAPHSARKAYNPSISI